MSFYIDIHPYGGAGIDTVCAEAVAFAKRIGCDVWFNFNSVRVLARPDDDAQMVRRAWDDALRHGWSHAATRSDI